MKVCRLILLTGVIAGAVAALCSCGQSRQAAPAEPFRPSAQAVDSVSYLVGVNLGASLALNDYGTLDMDRVMEGMKDFLAAKGHYTDEGFSEQFQIDPTLMNVVINDYLDQMTEYRNYQNQQAEQEFIQNVLQVDSTVVADSLGFYYRIKKEGRRLHPVDTSVVSIAFTCSLLDSTVVDRAESGYPRRVDLSKAVEGLSKGLSLIGEGGSMDLYVPASLAYGKEGVRGVPPGSMLCFDIELIDVKKQTEKK